MTANTRRNFVASAATAIAAIGGTSLLTPTPAAATTEKNTPQKKGAAMNPRFNLNDSIIMLVDHQ